MIGALLVGCGAVALAVGTWRGYVAAREALGPFVHEADATRTAVDAQRPFYARMRARLAARRLVISVGWLLVAMYGLYLVTVGQGLPR